MAQFFDEGVNDLAIGLQALGVPVTIFFLTCGGALNTDTSRIAVKNFMKQLVHYTLHEP